MAEIKKADVAKAEREKVARIKLDAKKKVAVDNAAELTRLVNGAAELVRGSLERGFYPTIHIKGGVLTVVAAFKSAAVIRGRGRPRKDEVSLECEDVCDLND